MKQKITPKHPSDTAAQNWQRRVMSGIRDAMNDQEAASKNAKLRDERLAIGVKSLGRKERFYRRHRKALRADRARINGAFSLITDPASKEDLYDFFVMRALGPDLFRMRNEDRWLGILDWIQNQPHSSQEPVPFVFEGEKIRFRGHPVQVAILRDERQYFFERDGKRIRPEAGDVVLDLGAASGDTAMVFAAAVGPQGRVVCCEPSAMEFDKLQTTLADNPHLASRIHADRSAVSSLSDQTVKIDESGTSSTVSESGGTPATTVSIDDMGARFDLERIDFIKMDIEGAELEALKGAKETIRRWRPKLAICVYHGWQVFDVIDFLRETLENYSVHIQTHAPVCMETVLYAAPLENTDA